MSPQTKTSPKTGGLMNPSYNLGFATRHDANRKSEPTFSPKWWVFKHGDDQQIKILAKTKSKLLAALFFPVILNKSHPKNGNMNQRFSLGVADVP